MDEQEQIRHITLPQAKLNHMEVLTQARVNRIEALMQQMFTMLAASDATSTGERIQVRNMLEELQRDIETTLEERPELKAIRAALLAGDRMKAIKLYRSTYGVGLKEAQDALDALKTLNKV